MCVPYTIRENCDLIFCCSQKHLTAEGLHTAVIILHATVCFAFETHETH